MIKYLSPIALLFIRGKSELTSPPPTLILLEQGAVLRPGKSPSPLETDLGRGQKFDLK
jgi:hypothetical protein